MYALKVRVNQDLPTIAGADDLGVLNATVTCVGKLGAGSSPMGDAASADLFLTVGGLTSRAADLPDEHLAWITHRPLQAGDVISVEVLDTLTADAPVSGVEAEKRKHDEREYFEHCKKVYFDLRDKYDAQ